VLRAEQCPFHRHFSPTLHEIAKSRLPAQCETPLFPILKAPCPPCIIQSQPAAKSCQHPPPIFFISRRETLPPGSHLRQARMPGLRRGILASLLHNARTPLSRLRCASMVSRSLMAQICRGRRPFLFPLLEPLLTYILALGPPPPGSPLVLLPPPGVAWAILDQTGRWFAGLRAERVPSPHLPHQMTTSVQWAVLPGVSTPCRRLAGCPGVGPNLSAAP
jgi:hypothetical protein